MRTKHNTPAHTAANGKLVAATSEVIHTNQKHPFLTQEEGFVPVGELVPGMHVLRADGSVGVVEKWEMVPGSKQMYNLEVAQDHTFTVGDGQWIVHNAFCQVQDLNPIHSPETSGNRPYLQNLSDQQLLEAVNNPKDGKYLLVNTATGRLMDGNGRAYELQRRAASPDSSISPETRVYYEPYNSGGIPEPWEEGASDFFNLFEDL